VNYGSRLFNYFVVSYTQAGWMGEDLASDPTCRADRLDLDVYKDVF
jgi:hypothetical protein